MKKRHIVAPKSIRKHSKHIVIECGGDSCGNKQEIAYAWNEKGNDKAMCNKCGCQNHFEIPN